MSSEALERAMAILDHLCDDALEAPLSHTYGLNRDGLLQEYDTSCHYFALAVGLDALAADLAAARAREQRALDVCARPILEVEEQGLHVAATGNAYGLAKAVRAALERAHERG